MDLNENIEPLTLADYQILSNLLEKLRTPDNAPYSLNKLQGFLTAIISAPSLIKPSRWLRV
jgi:uncharacterized protein YecA (UPF0149 family)